MYKSYKHLFSLCLLSTVLFFLIAGGSGCSGSTRGTGGITVAGKLITPASMVLPGVMVTVLQTGDNAVTNEFGDFAIATESQSNGFIDLLFETNTLGTQTRIDGITSNTGTISATYVVDEPNNSVSPTDIQISNRDDSDDDDDSGSGFSDDDDNFDSDDDDFDSSDSDDDDSQSIDDDDSLDNSGSGSSSDSDDDDIDDDDSDNSGSGSDSDDVDDIDDDDF